MASNSTGPVRYETMTTLTVGPGSPWQNTVASFDAPGRVAVFAMPELPMSAFEPARYRP